MARRLTGLKGRVKAYPDRVKALNLALTGLNYQQIGDACGHSRNWAREAVEWALEATVEEAAKQVRQMQLARLDALIVKQWAYLENNDLPPHIHLQVMDRILRTEERRAKLLGLDAPVKQEVEQVTEVRVEFVDAGPAAADAAAE
jgi:hypothetical protein